MAKESDLKKVTNDTLLDSFEPKDYTDVGQAQIFADAYRYRLRHCEGMGWLSYKDGIWVQSDTDAHGYSQKLTDLQLQEASDRRRIKLMQGEKSTAKEEAYLQYVQTRRSSARISATLKEATPMLTIETSALDGDPLILNTPIGEIHLDTGEITPPMSLSTTSHT